MRSELVVMFPRRRKTAGSHELVVGGGEPNGFSGVGFCCLVNFFVKRLERIEEGNLEPLRYGKCFWFWFWGEMG